VKEKRLRQELGEEDCKDRRARRRVWGLVRGIEGMWRTSDGGRKLGRRSVWIGRTGDGRSSLVRRIARM
jgi:hypothetical protein